MSDFASLHTLHWSSSFMAARHGPRLLSLRRGSRLSRPSAWGNFSASPIAVQDQRLVAEQDQLPCGPTDTSSANCRQTETHMVRTCHALQKLPKNLSSGHLGGWATSRSAEKMLNGQQQRVDVPVHVWIAHKSLPQKQKQKPARGPMLNRRSSV